MRAMYCEGLNRAGGSLDVCRWCLEGARRDFRDDMVPLKKDQHQAIHRDNGMTSMKGTNYKRDFTTCDYELLI